MLVLRWSKVGKKVGKKLVKRWSKVGPKLGSDSDLVWLLIYFNLLDLVDFLLGFHGPIRIELG